MTSYAIQTQNLVKTYKSGMPILGTKSDAVDGLSLNVPEGSIYGLLGRNSSGKTTTIRMAMGLARPTSGTMRVFGLDPASDPSRVQVLRQVGYVPEDKALMVGFTPRKIFQLNRAYFPDTWSDELAQKVCSRLELPLDVPFVKASLGNKTKTALATAIAQRSRLLILDEPTTGLDPVATDELLRILIEECTQDGRTIFLSTHQLPEIERIADHIGIMDHGRLLLEGSLDDIRASFRRISATGLMLPRFDANVLSTKQDAHSTHYIVRSSPAEFEQHLSSNGATIISSEPLSLTELFLELCRPSGTRKGEAA